MESLKYYNIVPFEMTNKFDISDRRRQVAGSVGQRLNYWTPFVEDA
jgi:hypothetical protein